MASMSGYTKLFNSILASTVWREPMETRIVWITLLAMADKDGIAEGSVPGLADFARIPVEATREALVRLSSPDPDSRSRDNEGRRIQAVDGGWQLLNHAKYRAKMGADERREYNRMKQAQHRARQQVSLTVNQNVCSQDNTEAKAKAKAKELKDMLVMPDWVDVMAWTEWEKFRIEQKKPLSDLSRRKCFSLLEKNKGHQKEIIDMSIMNGWSGLFPIKVTTKKAKSAVDLVEEAYREEK